MLRGNLIINRGIYHVSFRVKDENGKWKQQLRSTGIKAVKGNKRKAEERMHEMLEEYERSLTRRRTDILLTDYMKKWLDIREARLSPTTYDNYIHSFDKHIKPYFKGLLLRDVVSTDLEEYYSVKMKEGLSANTVIKHGTLLGTVMKSARKDGLIQFNPADLADKPKRKRPVNNFMKPDELRELWSRMKTTEIAMPVYFAVFFGLRRSEAVGVRWSAIDFENRTLSVRCTVIVAKDGEGKFRPMIRDDVTKSDTSKRVFYLNDKHIAFLKEVRDRQRELTRLTSKYEDFVCVNGIGELLNPDLVSHKFGELLDKFGLRHIRYHDLRHSCLSAIANDPGFTMKQVQEYAGHADFSVTANTYSHVDPSVKLAELDALTGMLFGD